jgi:predicted kinase
MFAGSSRPVFVVVNGPPGSGKTSVAEQLAPLLGLPLISKDVIKEALMGVWTVVDVERSRRLGRAAMAVMFSIAEDASSGAVLEANFRRSLAHHELKRLPGDVVEVFCRCPREICLTRYRARAGARAAGHLDSQRSDAEIWDIETVNPVAGGWPVIEVQTSVPVDLDGLLATLKSL